MALFTKICVLPDFTKENPNQAELKYNSYFSSYMSLGALEVGLLVFVIAVFLCFVSVEFWLAS